MSDQIHCAILYCEIFLTFSTRTHTIVILSLLLWSVWPTSTFTTTMLRTTTTMSDGSIVHASLIRWNFPLNYFLHSILFSLPFLFHFSSVFFFVKKISLTFCWQFSCVSNQDIDFLISITEYRLKVKTDIMNFE